MNFLSHLPFTKAKKVLITTLLLFLSIWGFDSFYNQGHLIQTIKNRTITVASTRNHTVGKRDLPIYCVATEKKQIALTFDVAWGNEDIPQIMDLLSKYDVKATFFITGEWVEKFPEDVKYIADLGHDLGNHGDNHKHMSTLEQSQIRSEIQGAHDKIKAVTGIEMNLFRPPYGDYNNELITTANDMNYYSIQWDVDARVMILENSNFCLTIFNYNLFSI